MRIRSTQEEKECREKYVRKSVFDITELVCIDVRKNTHQAHEMITTSVNNIKGCVAFHFVFTLLVGTRQWPQAGIICEVVEWMIQDGSYPWVCNL